MAAFIQDILGLLSEAYRERHGQFLSKLYLKLATSLPRMLQTAPYMAILLHAVSLPRICEHSTTVLRAGMVHGQNLPYKAILLQVRFTSPAL